MNVSRNEPWTVLNQLQRHLNQYFDGDTTGNNSTSSAATADWIPAADIEEYADRFVLKIDIPGVDPGGVEITLEQGVLSVVGNRAKDQAESDLQRERSERPLGRFHRRFSLPETADSNGVRAAGKNGVLQIVIPKQPKAQPKRIKIALDN
ncbi:MAG: Hsp20/alpha crystallin family protein [Steroidobacteraceae bacterium]